MEGSSNSKKNIVFIPVFIALAMIIGFLLGNFLNFNVSGTTINTKSTVFKNNKINNVLYFIEKSYVDTVNKDAIVESAINNILQSLDPHSYYLSARDFNEANDPLMGSFDGIGIEFRLQKDTIIVLNVISGGPSEKVGLNAGDRIIEVDKKNVANKKISNTDVVGILKGKKGTKVEVGVQRRNAAGLLYFTITRDKIPTYSVDIAYEISPAIGYMKISKFSATTIKEFKNALAKLIDKGMQKLILDLRGNGGGFLDAAISLADEFLEKDKLVVFTQGRTRPKAESFATKAGNFEHGDLVILIDEWSASASEILAGAVQDNDRGIIIGRRSFGKGLVQEQINLGDGSAIRLTIARYYTPAGRCIQRHYSKNVEEYYQEFYERIITEDSDSVQKKNEDTILYKTLSGRIVHGGGGITPDIIVKNDTSGWSRYLNALLSKNVIAQYAFNYADKNRNMLKKQYTDSKKFVKGFQVSDIMLNELINYGAQSGVPIDKLGFAQSKELMRYQLKALIGRHIFNNEGFYPVLNQHDNVIEKALEVLKNPVNLATINKNIK